MDDILEVRLQLPGEIQDYIYSLYGLSGIENRGADLKTIVPVGGYFLASTLYGEFNEGKYVSEYGADDITGVMRENVLNFVRIDRNVMTRLSRRPTRIQYRLMRKDNGLWVGTWAQEEDAGLVALNTHKFDAETIRRTSWNCPGFYNPKSKQRVDIQPEHL